jgi:hypothetical protein
MIVCLGNPLFCGVENFRSFRCYISHGISSQWNTILSRFWGQVGVRLIPLGTWAINSIVN